MTSLTIQAHKFDVPDAVANRYAIGSTIQTEGEAHALTQTLMENLRNNFAAQVKVALNGAETLPDAVLADLQTKFNEYAAAYQFGVRSVGTTRVVRDPLERKMVSLASDHIRKAYKAKHGSAVDKDQLPGLVEQLLEKRHDEYVKAAREILRAEERAKASAGDSTLADLGLVD